MQPDGVPESVEEISARWLTAALRLWSPAVPDIVHVDWETVGEGFGLTGVVARLHVTYVEPQVMLPSTIIVKLPTAEPRVASTYQARQSRHANEAYFARCARETRFYSDIAPLSPSLAPRCYMGVSSVRERSVMLLLEDIAGARQGDVLQGCSRDDAVAVLSAIAPFHARWWKGKADRPDVGDWVPRWSEGADDRPARYQRQIAPFLQKWGMTIDPDIVRIVERLGNCYGVVLSRLAELPDTLIHADLHLDNVLFAPDETGRRAVILDWQSICWGPAVADVTQFVIGSLPPELRRSSGHDLIALYVECLAEYGIQQEIDSVYDDLRLMLLRMLAGTVSWLYSVDVTKDLGREHDLIVAALGDGRLVAALRDYEVASLVDALPS